ncbi:MAG: TetR/AcrR family transcriptional regulator [Myxococcaceae bacterium]
MVQNAPKPRGRPRSFDETEAVERAIQVYWSKGYDGVTIDDLVAGMGVGRPSLYSVFGDKRALFLRVFKAYAEKKGALAAKALLSPQALRDSLARFLKHAVETAIEKGALGDVFSCASRRLWTTQRSGNSCRTLRLAAWRWWNFVSGTGSVREKSRRTFL